MSRQAGETEGEIEVTEEMVEAGTDALIESGLMECPTRSASCVVRKILCAAIEKSGRVCRQIPESL